MNKTYIIYYTWANTSSNHAGMAYLAKELKRTRPNQIRLIEIPKRIEKWHAKLKRLHFYLLALWLRVFLAKGDKVVFMEYLGNCSGNQTGLAIKLRQWGVKSKFIGLVHLSGNNLLELYATTNYIKQGAAAVDNILLFGSSLAAFFAELGYKHKVIRTFHYVDTEYYKPSIEQKNEKLQVIHIGSMKRNFERLSNVVKSCPEIDFHICQGLGDFSEYFKNITNVKLYGLLSEEKLLKLMQSCHVSIGILDDTVGSNVITTSMACGLVNVVSDIGSIRDYCNHKNAILCKNNEDFQQVLYELEKNRIKLTELSSNAVSDSKKINLEKSILFFETNLIN